MKVELKISRNKGKTITKVIYVKGVKTDYQAEKEAQLIYLNNYISRDFKRKYIEDLSVAKKISGLNVTAKVL